MQDPLLTIKQMALHDPNTQQFLPEGTASPMDWIKATIKFVYSEKGNAFSPPLKAKWNSQDEAVDMIPMKSMLDWLYNDQEVQPFNIPLTQVMVNALIEENSFAFLPHVTLLLQNQAMIQEAVSDLLSQLPPMGLTDAKKISVSQENRERKGDRPGTHSSKVEIFKLLRNGMNKVASMRLTLL